MSYTEDREFLREIVSKPMDAVSAPEFMRLWGIANRVEALEREVEAKQAEIDRLMLEYCPEDMTPGQIVEWAKCQRAVEPGEREEG